MRARHRVIAALLAATVAVSCGSNTAPEPESLAGARRLPTQAELSRETVLVELSQLTADGRHYENLMVTLTPSNQVEVKRLRGETALWPDGKQPKTLYLKTYQIHASRADTARMRLAALHPEQLRFGSDAPTVLPEGCQLVLDGDSDAVVLFAGSDKRVGVFQLQRGCHSPVVPRVKKAIREGLGHLDVTPAQHGFSI